MPKKNFYTISREKFNFLECDYNFTFSKCTKEDWGYELIYKNDTTGVKITYEYREAYIFIKLCELINGEIQEPPRNIQDDDTLHCYGLDDLITICSPQDMIKPAYEYGDESIYYDRENGLTLYVSAFAKNLKLYGEDILKGNFKAFSELDKIVKRRAKLYK